MENTVYLAIKCGPKVAKPLAVDTSGATPKGKRPAAPGRAHNQ